MDDTERLTFLWHALNNCKQLNGDVAISTVTHWLEYHGAGYPDVPLMQERVRDDAAFWAASATQPELEAYMAAALMALDGSPLTDRAAKRLAAMGVKNMKAESLLRFKEWVSNE